MTSDSKISWTNKTWNPVTGCSKVSEGCDHCYAEELSVRRGWSPAAWTQENAALNVRLRPERLKDPFTFKPGTRVFVNSMSDLFHDLVPEDHIASVFAVMALTPAVTYQVLTKRPGRMASVVSHLHDAVDDRAMDLGVQRNLLNTRGVAWTWPLPNVWLGTSVENQRWADVRIPQLLRTTAAVRFLSCEPLLGPIHLQRWLQPAVWANGDPHRLVEAVGHAAREIDWVIVGGESGRHFRGEGIQSPRWMRDAWVWPIRDACVEAGVAFFMKQGSGLVSEQRPWVVEPDGTRTKWEQYPGDLREPALVG